MYSQLQQGGGAPGEGYNGMLDCFRKIIKNEGYACLPYAPRFSPRLTGRIYIASPVSTVVSQPPS